MNSDILAKNKPKRKSQKQQVLEHLQSGKTLTQAEAITLCKSYRLGAIIHVLRGEGHDIVTIPEKIMVMVFMLVICIRGNWYE